jgi:IS5 family transposase
MFKRNKGMSEFADQWLADAPPNETLDTLDRVINWEPIRKRLATAYASSGRRGFDPVMMLKLTLLQHWYQLSDTRVIDEAADRLSFRRFLGVGVGDTLPDATTLVRFRDRLIKNDGLLGEVLDYVNATIASQGFALNTGRIVDASLVKAHTRPRSKNNENEIEPEADKTVKRGKPHYGYKMHMAVDVDTNVVTAVRVTPASYHDSNVFQQLLDGDEPAVYADRGYEGAERRRWLRERNIDDRIARRAARNHPLTQQAKETNRQWNRIRSGIERKFGEMKLWHGMARMRYVGLARGKLQAHFTALVTNLKFLAGKCA